MKASKVSECYGKVDTHRAFDYLWSVWHYMGIHALEQTNHFKIKYYYLYSLIVNISVTLLFPTTLIANLFFSQNQAQLFENLVIIVADLTANFKFIYICLVRTNLLRIKTILQHLDGRAQTNEELEILKKAVHRARSLFLAFGMLFSIGTFLSVIRVAFNQNKMLFFPAWFYVDWQHSNWHYTLVLTYQFIGLVVQATQNCANDAYPPSYLCILIAQIRALELRVRRLGDVGSNTEAQLDKNYKELLTCIADHNKILNLHQIINDSLSVSCVAQFVCTLLLQCFIAVHFIYVVDSQDRSAQLLSIIFFVSAASEAFSICYYAEQMRVQNNALTDAFYSCNWYNQSKRFKCVILVAILRTQHQFGIFAGNYISVDLNNFLKVCRNYSKLGCISDRLSTSDNRNAISLSATNQLKPEMQTGFEPNRFLNRTFAFLGF